MMFCPWGGRGSVKLGTARERQQTMEGSANVGFGNGSNVFWIDSEGFGPTWIDSDCFEQIWIDLDCFGPIWNDLDGFDNICHDVNLCQYESVVCSTLAIVKDRSYIQRISIATQFEQKPEAKSGPIASSKPKTFACFNRKFCPSETNLATWPPVNLTMCIPTDRLTREMLLAASCIWIAEGRK